MTFFTVRVKPVVKDGHTCICVHKREREREREEKKRERERERERERRKKERESVTGCHAKLRVQSASETVSWFEEAEGQVGRDV